MTRNNCEKHNQINASHCEEHGVSLDDMDMPPLENDSDGELKGTLLNFFALSCVLTVINLGIAGFNLFALITGQLDFVAGSMTYAFFLLAVYLVATIVGVMLLESFFNKDPKTLSVFWTLAIVNTVGMLFLPLFVGTLIRTVLIMLLFFFFLGGVRYLRDSEDVYHYFGTSLSTKNSTSPHKGKNGIAPRVAASKADRKEWTKPEDYEEDLFEVVDVNK
ncbi:MAG: hypothetical protein FWE48_06655 [Coriobacteriia bacterium]|nr:hypothetical protein [Coriobacteriia bacterium]